MKWCRLYADTQDNMDLQSAEPDVRYCWYAALGIAATEEANGCLRLAHRTFSPEQVFARKAHIRVSLSKKALNYYVESEMLCIRKNDYFIKNWGRYQRKSDTSAERTRRYRDRAVTSPRRPRAEQSREEHTPPTPPRGGAAWPECFRTHEVKVKVGKEWVTAPAFQHAARAFESRFGVPSAVDFARITNAVEDVAGCAGCARGQDDARRCLDNVLFAIQKGRAKATLPAFVRTVWDETA